MSHLPRLIDLELASWRPAKTDGVSAPVVIQGSGAIMESLGGSEVPVQFERPS